MTCVRPCATVGLHAIRCRFTRRPLEQRSTRIVFFIAGFGMAAWAPLVPFAKARAGIGDGALGLLLLCLGVGSLVTMSLAGALAARFGCRRVVIASAVPLCLVLPLLATVSSPALLAAALLVFGASLGAIDVTMNIQAIIVERASGRSMMSGFHGLFSIGGIAGAACVAALLGAGASPLAATLCVVGGIIVALAMAASHLLPQGSEREGPAFALPHGVVLFIGALCFIAFLAEGAMLDWSAVFLTSVRGVETAYGGLGYAVFSLTMSIGRLTGDRIVQRFGGTGVIAFGGICAAAGFAFATLVPWWQMTLLGYASDRRRLLQHRAGPVYQRRAPDSDAGIRGRPGDHHTRLSRASSPARRPSASSHMRPACRRRS